MSKIYSRPRIKIPKVIGLKKKSNYINFIFIILIAIIIFSIFFKSVMPIYDSVCKEKAKALATIIVNEQSTNIMKQHEYDELFSIEKDNDGNIVMVKSNIRPINEIISDVAVEIQKQIDLRGKDEIKIPIGSFTGLKLLAGKGWEAPIKIATVGNVETDLRSEFKDQGINQTLHRVYLQIQCQISIITPYEDIKEMINNQVLIAENVIIGKIPGSYYNLNGMDYNNTIDVIK